MRVPLYPAFVNGHVVDEKVWPLWVWTEHILIINNVIVEDEPRGMCSMIMTSGIVLNFRMSADDLIKEIETAELQRRN